MAAEGGEGELCVKKGRKRLRNPDEWTKKHVKKRGLRKNSPRAQLTEDMECCQKACLKQFSAPHLRNLREKFETLYYEEQNLYLVGLIGRHEAKKSVGHARQADTPKFPSGKRVGRPPAEESGFTFTYYLHDEKYTSCKVCLKAFCTVLGFGQKRLQVLRQKVRCAGDSCVEPDKRGKHSNRPQQICDEVRDLVREHISTFPARNSHYFRKDNHGRTYLSPELSIARLYRNFLEKHDPEYLKLEEANLRLKISCNPTEKIRKPLVSEHFYHDIFTSEFKIYFGYPRTDTCSTCDALCVQIEACQSTSEQQKLEEEHESHKLLAETGYDTFRKDQQLSRASWSQVQEGDTC